MNKKAMKYGIWIIRFLGILFGLILFGCCLYVTCFFVEDNSGHFPASFWERLLMNLPYMFFGIIFILPYKLMKKTYFFYPLIVSFALYLISFTILLYSARNSTANDPFLLQVIKYGIYGLLVLNIGVFFKITKNKRGS